MELKRFLVLSAVLALAFTMANPAHAQFGNLLNKTKKAVEKKVKKTAKSAAEKAGVPIEDSSISGDDGSGLTTLYKKKLTPSSEALSTDKFANDESVPKGFSKSYKQIHAAYERLDPAYFPLQPYYKYPSTYALGSDRMTLYPEAVFLEFMQKYLTNVVGSSTRKVTVESPRPSSW
ncbi:hypothetical protein FHS60_001516 [Alloprevotella rava]|uniref:Uncharacterized protein n=2 Tax=Alloprevotella rava TaxID=671218 RepID=A0A7W5XY13_9BACT|nr:hypothetical protein [Alloprevotella rava]